MLGLSVCVWGGKLASSPSLFAVSALAVVFLAHIDPRLHGPIHLILLSSAVLVGLSSANHL